MGIVSGLVSLFSSGIVGEVGKAIDDNITSDEERGKLKNELANIEAKAEGKAQDFALKIEEGVTARHAADMNSDSKLSKNVRPYTLIVLTTFTLLYMLVPVFKELGTASSNAYNASLTALISLDMLVYGFYFGSRGVEKVMTSVATALKPKPKPKEVDDDDLGW